MTRTVVALALLALAQDPRKPVPEPAAQATVEKTVKELFKDDYARRTPADLSALARKLLTQGLSTNDDLTGRYVLLREARDLGAQSGDLATAQAAIDDLARTFVLDALEMTTAAMTTAAKSAKTPEALEAVANGYLGLADKALAGDRYDDAAALLVKAENAAKAAQNFPLLTRAQAQRKEVADLLKEFQRVKAAEKTLAENPDDPAACAAVGKFLCLMKRDWEKGLPMLAKGNDAALQAAAQKDLAGSAMEAGDAWWEIADKTKETVSKRKLLARARLWYERALPALSGLSKAKVEKRLEEIDQAGASGAVVDVLALIDPKKDATGGAWEKSGAALLSPMAVAQASLQIPYLPPPEYDLKLVVERKDIHVLHLGLPSGDVRIDVDVDNQSTWGNLNFDSAPTKASIVKYNTAYIPVGKPATILCTVRRNGVWIAIDGKIVLAYEGDITNAKPVAAWKPPNPKALSLGSWAGWVFTKIQLIPVTGQGKKLRP
jgi:hypothetical protein